MTEHPMRKHTGGWVTVGNETVNDENLSFKAKGLLLYLLGRPPGWAFSAERIARTSKKDGREAVLSGLKELSEAGYYRWTRVRVEGGKFAVVTEVAAHPSLMPPPPTSLTPCEREAGPGTALPTPADPASVEPASANPPPKAVHERVTTESQNPPAPSEQAPPLEAEPKPTSKRRGTRLPEDWRPDDTLIDWTMEQGVPRGQVSAVVEVFVDYWIAQPGQKGSKVDWNATWRNWVRKDVAEKAAQARREAGRQTPQERDRAILEASLQRGLAARQQDSTQTAIEGPRKTPWT